MIAMLSWDCLGKFDAARQSVVGKGSPRGFCLEWFKLYHPTLGRSGSLVLAPTHLRLACKSTSAPQPRGRSARAHSARWDCRTSPRLCRCVPCSRGPWAWLQPYREWRISSSNNTNTTVCGKEGCCVCSLGCREGRGAERRAMNLSLAIVRDHIMLPRVCLRIEAQESSMRWDGIRRMVLRVVVETAD